MSGSKTKYYVASSCSPIFNDEKRINQYKAAMLDYTANSPIEMSEYMKNYYNTSRLRNFRGYLNWCKTKGFSDVFGEVSSSFYSDAYIDNLKVTSALKPSLDPDGSKSLTVFSTKLAFFSEDFYIKYLATQQGKEDWVTQPGDLYYTISYPSAKEILAKFDGKGEIRGYLPSFNTRTRFLEISYSYSEKQVTPIEPDPNNPDGPTESVTKITKYGYLHYQEQTGNPALDVLIKDNAISGSKTFFPVIPLRSNTSWFTDKKAETIDNALKYLEIIGAEDKKSTPYKTLQKACTEGMKEGSIGDIDYISLILGVSLKSQKKADLAYIYEFFFNIHTNYYLSIGVPPSEVYTAKQLNAGKNYLGRFANKIIGEFNKAYYSDNYYHSYVIDCSATNLHLTYRWGGSDYFEANGQFKPNAKPGDYGVLSGDFVHRWVTYTTETDENGDEYQVAHYHSIPYTLVFFCKQESLNRWHFTLFVDLYQNNLIYHGKSINTHANNVIKNASGTATITHNFAYDFPSAPGEYHKFTLSYITSSGELDSPFIVPLEQSTFYEVGVKNNLEISYGSQFLIFNCWVKKKVKWYQRGFFSVFLSFVGVNIGLAIAPILPIIGAATITYFATALVVTLSAFMLDLTLKILTTIFGDRLGNQINNFARSLLGVVLAIVGKIPVFGWIIAGIIMFAVASGDALNSGMSLKDAILQGAKAGAVTAATSYFLNGPSGGPSPTDTAGTFVADSLISSGEGFLHSGIQAGVSAGITSAITSTALSLVNGASLKHALKSGLISGAQAFVFNFGADIVKNWLIDQNLLKKPVNTTGNSSESVKEQSVGELFKNFIKVEILENPMTYGKLLNMTIEEINYHKLANLENDFQEFSNAYKAAMDTYYEVSANQAEVITSQYICKLQCCMGRLLTYFPEVNQSLSPENVLILGISTGSEVIKTALGTVPSFVENKLSIDGYTPAELHYSKLDYTLTWDI